MTQSQKEGNIFLSHWNHYRWLSSWRTNQFEYVFMFKESALLVDSFYKSKCLYVCEFVFCLFARHTFSLCLTILLPPFPKVQCPLFLDIQNPWGESNGKKGSHIWTFLLSNGQELLRQNNFFSRTDFPFFTLLNVFLPPSPPPSWSPMSKLFRFVESLGKNNMKKWSQIWKLLLITDVKVPHKKVYLSANFVLLEGFFGIGATVCNGWEILIPP